jgi:hypothetical protein
MYKVLLIPQFLLFADLPYFAYPHKLKIVNNLNWKNHINQLVSKLSGACYVVRSVLHISNIAYFHSLMKYGIIFWGNSSDSKKVFTLQKKIVRIMMGVKSHNPCRDLFKRLQILTLPCEYIYIHNKLHYK